MMRSRFDEQLARLNQDMTMMGALCEESIALVAKALSSGDRGLLKRVAVLAIEIDRMERDQESLCLKMLLQQQPVASDLRQISAALKMVTDMRRIGDQAQDIAEIIASMEGHSIPAHTQIYEMAKDTTKMVTDSMDAYVKKDNELAQQVIQYDDVVDTCFCTVKNNLIHVIAQNPEEGAFALDLLMIAKYFERIGDHATNIAEWVQFSISGDIPQTPAEPGQNLYE